MAREQQQPMSDARLAEIREQLQMLMSGIAELDSERDSSLLMLYSGLDDVERLPVGSTLDVTRIYAANIHELLAEVERRRAREAALMEVVRAVAEANVICNHYFDILDGYPHPPEHVDYLCPTAGHPKASTVRAQARALLASGGDEAK